MLDPRLVVEAYFDAYNRHDAGAMAGFYSEWGDFSAPGGLTMRGRDEAAVYARAWLEAFPDLEVTVRRYLVSGQSVVAEGTMRGTHRGTLRLPGVALPPSGRRLEGEFMVVYEVEGAELISGHLYYDRGRLMQQLGQMPESRIA
jgi:predicted ester cyclase